MGSYYNCSEWAQRKLRDLEKLFSKRDPDNRDAQDKSQEEVAKGQQPSAYKKPDDVQESDRGPSPVFLYILGNSPAIISPSKEKTASSSP